MKQFFAIAALIFTPFTAFAEDNPLFLKVNKDTDLSVYQWTHRPVVVLANSTEDVNYKRQIRMLQKDIESLVDRDVIILTDTTPSPATPLRDALRPRGFFITKDGQIKQANFSLGTRIVPRNR